MPRKALAVAGLCIFAAGRRSDRATRNVVASSPRYEISSIGRLVVNQRKPFRGSV